MAGTDKKRTFDDYRTSDTRKKTVRAYVNKGELKLIKDACKQSMRVPNISDWAGAMLIKRACEILGLEYPYPEEE